MIDQYLMGNVNRVSPEAPVPVVDFLSTENRLGGAANVALNVKALGAKPILLSVIGKDQESEVFLELLKKEKLTTDFILQSKSRPTTIKTRVMAASQHLLRIDRETKQDISIKQEKKLLRLCKKIIKESRPDVLIFQDYNKGVLTKNFIESIILLTKENNIPTVVDPKFHHFYDYKNVHLFKPNLKEVQQQVPFPVTVDKASLLKAANYIENQLDNDLLMITLSEHGIFIKSKTNAQIIPTAPRVIADVCGAGDAVISVAALCMANHLSLKKTAELSNIAGGQVCERVGVVTIGIGDLEKEVS